jgi:D-glycero-D-manno-heptose 1,7-bisphosphate phosphatase
MRNLMFVTLVLVTSWWTVAGKAQNPQALELAQQATCVSETRRQLRKDLFQVPASGAIKVAFFDADSTLRVSKSGKVSANDVKDVVLLPNVGRALGQLHKAGYLIYIVSNQNGVGSGVITCDIADGALKFTIDEVFKAGGVVHGYDFAETANDYRKPGKGMATELESTLKRLYGENVFIDRVQSLMVGDSAFKKAKDASTPGDMRWDNTKFKVVPGTHFSNADRLFAQALGIHFIEATDFFGWRKYGIDVIESVKGLQEFLSRCSDCTR